MNTPPWLAIARSFLGLAEVPGPKHNPIILGWLKSLFWDWLGLNDETPWCGTFVSTCLQKAGQPWEKKGFRALEWKGYGVDGRVQMGRPALGAIAVLTREGGGHVAFVTGISADGLRVRLLGGNQGNRVCEAWFATSRVACYRAPYLLLTPAPVAVAGEMSKTEA